jgi:hypothetical protein
MPKLSPILAALLVTVAPALCGDQPGPNQWPRTGGTINIVVASDQEIVLLTDSMLTESWRDAAGIAHSRQLREPGQKLFRIDDRTVITFAGFASADTPVLKDFLNSVPAMVGRYQDRLRGLSPLSFSVKLDLIQDVFAYYLSGIENLRDGDEGDYQLQLMMAGYDLDGTARLGRIVLARSSRAGRTGLVSDSTAREHWVIRAGPRQIVCINGIGDAAIQMLRHTNEWIPDETSSACWRRSETAASLGPEEMKSLAIELEKQTAVRFPEVGGPKQIATFSNARLEIDQPSFPSVNISPFKFRIVTGVSMNSGAGPGSPYPYGVVVTGPGVFTLYFSNEFVHARQELDDGYFGRNRFKDCILLYRGGKTRLEKSNDEVDSDLEIASGVRRDSPEVKELLRDFGWRSVKYDVPMAPKL